ncbi:tRNA (adenosine(37)-N6)-dimethylallyltransferase MiaA [Frigoribacterium sp. CFBP 13712]|uniref:tRNA (adenosine(37)-N6)-dimethylallyltransferase MiaA n=1 Tax=Frigoribacterium sp. CFBP 13712 TaxID=2775309 RepID=UPI00177B9EB4|nr:tRNA (adenosine(37)-N6)-dimethylallyltransferase MiaA [Frigoribacterium sp. CFBP 13712]MBD8703301.1 tRNA (adenosine(37)-N6)-dimethylallyltransferase MiaA [Frigoribacterium sp. CFBP 13712]
MLIALVGATGTGKSALSLDLAERLRSSGRPAEIVNADAMQLYRGMDIGTAKLPVSERRGIPHHLLDELDVTDEASVEWYQRRARTVIDEVHGRGAVAVLVGGSGLYVSSVLFDLRFPGTDPAIRARYEAVGEAQGPGALFRLLRDRDPLAAEKIGSTNIRRLVRALEVGELTGEPFSARLPDEAARWRPSAIVGVRDDREALVERLDARVERMWRDGLVDEVRGLLAHGLERGVTAGRAIGYAQAAAQLRGELTESDAIETSAALTRRYARRQVSWFRRYPDVRWVPSGDPGGVEAALDTLDA